MVIMMASLTGIGVRIVLLALTAIIVLVDLFVRIPAYNSMVQTILTMGILIAAFTVAVGAVSVIVLHTRRIANRSPGQWYFSIYTLALMAMTFLLERLPFPQASELYSVLVTRVYGPLSQCAYGLIGFYVISCLYRSFRGRTSYVIVFLVAGILTLFSNAPIFALVDPRLQTIGYWIRDVPAVAGFRGLILGTAIGTIATGVRTILGFERSSIGG